METIHQKPSESLKEKIQQGQIKISENGNYLVRPKKLQKFQVKINYNDFCEGQNKLNLRGMAAEFLPRVCLNL